MAMECNRCSEQQDQETTDDAIVGGYANELFVCLKCQDEVEDSICVNGTEWCELDGHLCADCAADRADYAHDFMEAR